MVAGCVSKLGFSLVLGFKIRELNGTGSLINVGGGIEKLQTFLPDSFTRSNKHQHPITRTTYEAGKWLKVFNTLIEDPDFDWAFIDGTAAVGMAVTCHPPAQIRTCRITA